MTTLDRRIILVIGGTSGIGFGVAKASLKSLAQDVIVASSNKDRVEHAVKKLSTGDFGPGDVRGYVVDARREESIKGLLDEVGEVDHIVFTSGIIEDIYHKVSDVDTSTAKGSLDLSLWSALAVARHAKLRPGGSLTFTSGTNALKPFPSCFVAAAAGGGLHSLVKALAVELAPIRVNAVCAGVVKTELWDQIPVKNLLENMGSKLLVGHVGMPDAVAEAYLFCMKCNFITGQFLVVDGGLLLNSA